MKKSLFSIVLAGTILVQTVPVLASEDIDPIHRVSFSTIRSEVEERNPVLEANRDDFQDGKDDASAALKMFIQQEELVDATITGITSAYFEVGETDYNSLSDVIKAFILKPTNSSVPVIMNKDDSSIIYGISTSNNKAGNPIWFILPQNYSDGTNITVDTENNTVDLSTELRSMYLNIISLYESQIMALEAQYISVDNSRDESWKYHINLDQGSDQMVWAAQQLILSYNSLQEQLQTLSVQKELLIRQRKVAELQVQLGLITAIEQTDTEASLNDLDFSMKSLSQGIDSIRENLNIILGQEYDNELTIDPLVPLDKKALDDINYDSDLEQAMEQSFAVRLADDNNDIEEQQKRTLKATFDQTSKDIALKVEALALEQTKLNNEQVKLSYAELKYSLGMISNLALEAAKLPYQNQLAKFEAAESNLLKSYTQYQWLLEGFNVAG